MNPAATMRALLATQGIFLDETPAASPAATSSPTTSPEAIDREAIREILLERGAPMRDLDWLVASCPSMEHALAFEPTPWMTRDFTDYMED